MREIKFRAWDKDDKCWVHYNGRRRLLQDEVLRVALAFPMSVVLEQYTGLKDKNGKKIYEGDLCEIDSKRGRMIAEIKLPDIWEGVGYRDAKDDIPMNLEVIGDIHNNPELLEEKT